MKCDHIRTRAQGDTPFFPNMLNNANVEVCLKEDVDKAIAELKAANKLLKEHIANGDVSRITWIDEVIELKQKLEDVQASMYCDVVDANMENRRLKRALWLSRADRAHKEVILFRDFSCLVGKEFKWRKVEKLCRAKAKEYK